MNKKKKYILIISIILIILISILAIVGSTTSFFGWKAEKEATVDVTIAGGEGECSLKNDNNRFIEPSLTKNSGRIIKLKASQSMGSKASIAWNMNVKSIAGLQDASFKYEMINTSTGISYGSGDFKNVSSGSTITFSTTEEVLGFGLEYEFTLYLWIDGTFGNYQSLMADDTLDFAISCNLVSTETGTVYEPQITLDETAAGHIQKLYDDANKTLITQENSGDQYYYATSVNLMNDGLGSENNIRYYGNSPANYIYFNCSDYSNQTSETCEIWRIVGVFDDKVKIVRQDPIGEYSWDYTSTGESEANWHDATIMTLLNNGYYNNSNNVTYYNNSTTPITVDFATSGIGFKNEDTRNMVSESTWYLGAWDKGNIYPDLVYGYERGYEKCATCTGESTWTGKLALLYASDYGYAADLRYCDTDMNNYQISECISNNWLFKSGYMTFINSHFGFSNFVWGQRTVGHIRTGTRTDTPHPIYPTLYLNENTAFNTEGNGTSSNPYQLAVPNQIEYVYFE